LIQHKLFEEALAVDSAENGAVPGRT